MLAALQCKTTQLSKLQVFVCVREANLIWLSFFYIVRLGDKASKVEGDRKRDDHILRLFLTQNSQTNIWLKGKRLSKLMFIARHQAQHNRLQKNPEELYCEVIPWKIFETKVRQSIYLIIYLRH